MDKKGFTPLEIAHLVGNKISNSLGKNSLTGFTFIEVLVTVVIIAVGLVAIMNWVPLNIQTKIKLERRTTAIFLAQERVDDIKRSALANYDDNFNWAVPQSWSVPYDNFRWTSSDNPDTAALRSISVSAWHIEEPDNKITFDTKIARR
jgi:prepilin-type N-terminal cleavage/methylation domain-containing protein